MPTCEVNRKARGLARLREQRVEGAGPRRALGEPHTDTGGGWAGCQRDDAGPLEPHGLKTGGVSPGLCTRRVARQKHGEGPLLGNLSEK